MGGGFYSYSSAKFKADNCKAMYTTCAASAGDYAARKQVFKNYSISEEMKISNKVRECRDSTEHPNTIPVIIGLDVTGSMGSIPNYLVTEAFPEIMKKIQDEGIKDVQVCFVGIGDHECDKAPIQVGQFESSDDLMEKWLKAIYLEGGGGGNDGESYGLAWYVASRCTSCDAITKRGKKGIVITIGDEPNLKHYPKSSLADMFGGAEKNLSDKELLEETRENWDVYHINVVDFSGGRKATRNYWSQLLKNNCILTQDPGGKDIVDIIAGVIIKAVNSANNNVEHTVNSEPSVSTEIPSEDPLKDWV